jgi:hypothetical protein
MYKSFKKNSECNSAKLASSGLVGEKLDFKLNGFPEIIEKLCNNLICWPWEKIKDVTKFILKWINTILNSLKSALPVLEIFQEFKERIEVGIEGYELCEKYDDFEFLKL